MYHFHQAERNVAADEWQIGVLLAMDSTNPLFSKVSRLPLYKQLQKIIFNFQVFALDYSAVAPSEAT